MPHSWFMLSLADPSKYYQVLLAQGVGIGIGSGMLLVPAYSIQAHHFRRRRTLAMGVVSSGTAIGGIVYPIMLNQLFDDPSAGFAWGVRAAGFLTAGLLVVASALMRTRLPSARERRRAARRAGEKASKGVDVWAILRDWPYMCDVVGCVLWDF